MDARPLLLLVQDASPELQALGLRLLQHLADPESQRNWSLEPKTLNAALLQAMPKQPLPCPAAYLRRFWASDPRFGAPGHLSPQGGRL